MSSSIDKELHERIGVVRAVYIYEYRELITDNDLSFEEAVTALELRIMARIDKKVVTNDKSHADLIDDAISAEFDLLHLLKFNPKEMSAKKKTSFFSRGVKKTLKVLSDNDMSGYAARHTPVNHTVLDVTTTTPVDTSIDTLATDYAAVGIQGVNTLSVPFLYLYYYSRGEPIPFTLKNNAKFVLSGIGLALGIVSLTVPPVGIFIALTTASIGFIASIYSFGRFIRERMVINHVKNEVETKITTLAEEIRSTKAKIHSTKEILLGEISSLHPNMEKIENKTKKLQKKYRKLQNCQLELKERIKERHALKLDEGKEKTIFGATSTSMKILLASTVIAGLVLSFIPFTTAIGVPMLITAATIGIALYAANKVHHARMTSKEKAAVKADQDMALTKKDGLAASSTLKTAVELHADLNKPAKAEAMAVIAPVATEEHAEPAPSVDQEDNKHGKGRDLTQ